MIKSGEFKYDLLINHRSILSELELNINYYNLRINTWEPIIEKLILSLYLDKTNIEMTIAVSNTKRNGNIEINITDDFIKTLFDIATKFKGIWKYVENNEEELIEECKWKLKENKGTLFVENYSGYPISIHYLKQNYNIKENETEEIDINFALPAFFSQQKLTSEKLNINFEFSATNIYTISNVDIDNPNELPYTFESKQSINSEVIDTRKRSKTVVLKEKSKLDYTKKMNEIISQDFIVCQVIFTSIGKTLTLASRYTIYNNLIFPIWVIN